MFRYFRDLHLFAVPVLFPALLAAQTFNGIGSPIPDDGSTLDILLGVSGLASPLNTTTYGLEQACFTIDHERIADLEIRLVAPDGTAVLLVSGQGDESGHFSNTCFSDDAGLPIAQGIPPYSGTYHPQTDLSTINNGQVGNGQWRLRVHDMVPFAHTGTVLGWGITFGDQPAGPNGFHSSNLPILLIETLGQPIISGGKVPAHMGIIDNGWGNINHITDPPSDFNGSIGIDIHGNSSNSQSPKKSYGVELRDDLGEDLDLPILGMPAGSDWILLANYFDKSLMNNTLTYHLARAMGDYAPRQRDVEVMLDGEYLGVYACVEKIKRGGDRVDIAKLSADEIFGDDLSGGYILSVERDSGPLNGFISPFSPTVSGNGQYTFLEYRYPKPDNIVPEQRAYIQAYVDSFQTVLAGPDFLDPDMGYRKYMDIPSFVDLFLINEFSRNVDAYRLSSYLYKDKYSNGGKLHAGPAWDYDLAWGNANYCNGYSTTGWAYRFGDYCADRPYQIPFWWARLQEDSAFVAAVRCRWNELRDNVLSPAYISAYCDSVAALLNEGQQRNFTRWPILGVYVWPNPQPVPTTYAGEVQELKDFMNARWAWIDTNLPGAGDCTVLGAAGPSAAAIEVPFPNPFTNDISFRTSTSDVVTVKLIDPLGREVQQKGPFFCQGNLHRIQLPPNMASGSYVLIATTRSGLFSAFRIEHE